MMFAKQPMENHRGQTLMTISPIKVELKDNFIVNENTTLKINNTAVQKVIRI